MLTDQELAADSRQFAKAARAELEGSDLRVRGLLVGVRLLMTFWDRFRRKNTVVTSAAPGLTAPGHATRTKLGDALDDSFPASDPAPQLDPTHGVRASPARPDEEAIRWRAYELWQKAGSPEGRHEEHWLQARSELEAETKT